MKKTVALLLALLMILSVPALAFADNDAEITVTGTGEVLVAADMAVVNLGVTATDPEVLTAQAKANEAIASVRAALLEIGVAEADISTDYLNIYAMYDYSSYGTEKITGYNANSTLAIKVSDIEKVGEVIDAAFGAGANTLNGISFSAKDTTEANEQAMRAAVADARAKAEILADAAGLRIRGIEDIVEQSTYTYDQRGSGKVFQESAADAGGGTVIQAAKLTVSSTITVTFRVTD